MPSRPQTYTPLLGSHHLFHWTTGHEYVASNFMAREKNSAKTATILGPSASIAIPLEKPAFPSVVSQSLHGRCERLRQVTRDERYSEERQGHPHIGAVVLRRGLKEHGCNAGPFGGGAFERWSAVRIGRRDCAFGAELAYRFCVPQDPSHFAIGGLKRRQAVVLIDATANGLKKETSNSPITKESGKLPSGTPVNRARALRHDR